VQHCLEISPDAAERTLDAVVRRQLDFLVPHACQPKVGRLRMTLAKYIDSRFCARTWLRSHQRGSSYQVLLARALLLTPALVVPDEFLDAPFLAAFETEARRLAALPWAVRVHNFRAVREHAVTGPILRTVEEEYPREMQRYLSLYESLLQTLEHGLPPLVVVRRLLGASNSEAYRELLETCDNYDLDVDRARARGEQRQARGQALWSQRDARRVLSLLSLYCEGHQRGLDTVSIGEEYERFRQGETERYNEEHRAQLQWANDLGGWRIRRNEAERWRAALSADEWRVYRECEAVMRETLPSGVFSKVPRRHFNAASVAHMRATNLSVLRERLIYSSPAVPDEVL